MPKGCQFRALLMASLCDRRGAGLRNATVDHAEIVIEKGRVFEGGGADFGALGGDAAAEVVETQRGIEPGARRPIKGVADDESFLIAVADEGQEESGFANVLAGGRGRVRQPDQRHAEEAEIWICHSNAGAER